MKIRDSYSFPTLSPKIRWLSLFFRSPKAAAMTFALVNQWFIAPKGGR